LRSTLPLLIALLLSLAACGGVREDAEDSSRPPVTARMEVDRATATLGDLITLTLTVDAREEVTVRVGDPVDGDGHIAGLPVVERGAEPPRQAGKRRISQRWWRLRAEELGSYIVPPVEIHWERTAPIDPVSAGIARGAGHLKTTELFLEVISVLPEGGEVSDIRDIKPPREPLLRFPRWLLILFGAVPALALIAALLRGLLRRRPKPPEAPPLPAHEVALRALAALALPGPEDAEAVRHFAFQLSEIVRTYVEARFDLNATDLTTEEILSRLPDLEALEARAEAELAHLLAGTDRVKFAPYEPWSEEIVAMAQQARAFVEATRPRPLPPDQTRRGEEPGGEVPGGEEPGGEGPGGEEVAA